MDVRCNCRGHVRGACWRHGSVLTFRFLHSASELPMETNGLRFSVSFEDFKASWMHTEVTVAGNLLRKETQSHQRLDAGRAPSCAREGKSCDVNLRRHGTGSAQRERCDGGVRCPGCEKRCSLFFSSSCTHGLVLMPQLRSGVDRPRCGVQVG